MQTWDEVSFVPGEINVSENWEGSWWFIIRRKLWTLESIFNPRSSFPPTGEFDGILSEDHSQNIIQKKNFSAYISQTANVTTNSTKGDFCTNKN